MVGPRSRISEQGRMGQYLGVTRNVRTMHRVETSSTRYRFRQASGEVPADI